MTETVNQIEIPEKTMMAGVLLSMVIESVLFTTGSRIQDLKISEFKSDSNPPGPQLSYWDVCFTGKTGIEGKPIKFTINLSYFREWRFRIVMNDDSSAYNAILENRKFEKDFTFKKVKEEVLKVINLLLYKTIDWKTW